MTDGIIIGGVAFVLFNLLFVLMACTDGEAEQQPHESGVRFLTRAFFEVWATLLGGLYRMVRWVVCWLFLAPETRRE